MEDISPRDDLDPELTAVTYDVLVGTPDEGKDFEAHLRACLEPLLGPHTTRHAIKLAAKELGAPKGGLTWAHADGATLALVPLLRTLIGRVSTEALQARILKREADPQ